MLIVGKGSLEKELIREINNNELNDRILLLGEKDQNWLSRCLPNCSCFVATHTGRALVEASFAGLPIVGYDIDWHSEIIKDGINGFLVKLGDKLSFSKSIIKIISNKDLSKRFSKILEKMLKTIITRKYIE